MKNTKKEKEAKEEKWGNMVKRPPESKARLFGKLYNGLAAVRKLTLHGRTFNGITFNWRTSTEHSTGELQNIQGEHSMG